MPQSVTFSSVSLARSAPAEYLIHLLVFRWTTDLLQPAPMWHSLAFQSSQSHIETFSLPLFWTFHNLPCEFRKVHQFICLYSLLSSVFLEKYCTPSKFSEHSFQPTSFLVVLFKRMCGFDWICAISFSNDGDVVTVSMWHPVFGRYCPLLSVW